MPIVFAQPEPAAVGGAYSSAYQGAYGDATLRSLPSIAGLYETGMRNDAQARMQAQQSSAQAAMQANQLDQRAHEFQAQRMDHAAEATAARMVQPIDLLHANQQFEVQKQRAQLQEWVNGRELSQKDVIYQQNLNNQLSTIQQKHAANLLTDQEASDLTLQVMTRVNPLDQRAEAMKVKKMEEESKLVAAKTKTMAESDAAGREFEKRQIELGNGVFRMVDPNTGKTHFLLKNKRSDEWYNPFTAGGRGEGEGGAGGGKGQLTEKDYLTQHTQLVKSTEDWIQKVWVPNNNNKQPTPEDRQAIYDAEFARIGLPKNLQEFRAQQAAGRGQGQGQGQPQPGQPQGQPQPQQPPPKNALLIVDESIKRINALPLPDQDRMAVNKAMEESKAMLASKNGYENLTAEEKKAFDRNREAVRKAIRDGEEALAARGPQMPQPRVVPPPNPEATAGFGAYRSR